MTYYLILFAGVSLNIIAQVILKKTVGGLEFSFSFLWPSLKNIIFNPWIWLSALAYGGGFIFYAIALTKLELSRAYPVASVAAVIIIFVISIISLNESFTVSKTAGLIFSVIGIFLLFR